MFTLKLQAMYMSDDPDYLSCNKHECKNECIVRTCSGTLTFHAINIRTDIEFVLYIQWGIQDALHSRQVRPLQFCQSKETDVEQTVMTLIFRLSSVFEITTEGKKALVEIIQALKSAFLLFIVIFVSLITFCSKVRIRSRLFWNNP